MARLDHDAAHLALRARALTLSIATTGAIDLAATATGFTRSGGSFLTDGFYVGMEIQPAGFSTNTAKTIKSVAALAILTEETGFVQASGAGRSLVAGVPSRRAWELVDFTPDPGRLYIAEEYAPAAPRLISGIAEGGDVEEFGTYRLTWVGLAGNGSSAIRRSVDALLALFTPYTSIVAGAHTLRIGGEPAPFAGEIRSLGNGWARCILTIPWRAFTTNAIAA
jgi:hypothetical protein